MNNQIEARIEFILKENGKREAFDATFESTNVRCGDTIALRNENGVIEYVYVYGSCKIWKPKEHILCAEEVELDSIEIKIKFKEGVEQDG